MKKLLALLLSLVLMLTLMTGCSSDDLMNTLTEWAKGFSDMLEAEDESAYVEKPMVREVPTLDRAGHLIHVPETITRVVSLTPYVTDTLVELGVGTKLQLTDTGSAGFLGVSEEEAILDPEALDVEAVLAASPQILFCDADTYLALNQAADLLEDDTEAEDDEDSVEILPLTAFEQLTSAGICVAVVTEPHTLNEIMHNTLFISYCLQEYEKGEALIYEMIDMLDKISEISKEVTNVRGVYVEPEPYVTVGYGEILNEMINITGAQNVFLSRDGLFEAETEDIVTANPAVIITCVGDVPLSEGETIHTVGQERMSEIANRNGWQDISAVVSGTLYYMESSLCPGPGIVDAIWEMAQMCYPNLYVQ